jgi:threonylcarbamoyladenosine tRNA methylthiotransferase MtaB
MTTDVMVGFPGESEAEFEEGFEYIRRIAFDGMHVFKYSPRSGTRAARLPDQVPEEVKSERSRILRAEADAGLARLLARHEGQAARIAWETERDGIWRGLSDTNVRAYAGSETARPGRLARVRLTDRFRDGLWAESQHAALQAFPAVPRP